MREELERAIEECERYYKSEYACIDLDLIKPIFNLAKTFLSVSEEMESSPDEDIQEVIERCTKVATRLVAERDADISAQKKYIDEIKYIASRNLEIEELNKKIYHKPTYKIKCAGRSFGKTMEQVDNIVSEIKKNPSLKHVEITVFSAEQQAEIEALKKALLV